MISKFHKTTYSRPPNFHAVSSSHGRRNPLYQQPHHDWANKYQHPIEKKIQIESSLLFTQKSYQKPNQKYVEQQRQPANRSEAKFYETSMGFTQAKERPQSKQEPRPKGKNEGKMKTQVFLPDRPQSSKGARACRANQSEIRQRQHSQNDEEYPVQIKVTEKKPTRAVHSSYARRPGRPGTNVVALDSALDPQFLNLFAN